MIDKFMLIFFFTGCATCFTIYNAVFLAALFVYVVNEKNFGLTDWLIDLLTAYLITF
jgi:hypothetical protein